MESASLEGPKNSHRLIMEKTTSSHFLSCFISFSYLQVTRTYIPACMSLVFDRIQPLTRELAALQYLKIDVSTFVSVAIDQIIF